MTLTASPRRPPPIVAAPGLGAGDTARARALRRRHGGYRDELAGHHALEDHMFTVPWLMAATTPAERTRILARAPLALKLVWYASLRRHARLSTRALGPATHGVA